MMENTERHDTLGDNVLPSRYDLRLEPDLSTFEYKGEEEIEVLIKDGTSEIVLNSGDLEINGASIKDRKGIQHARMDLDRKKQLLSLKVGRKAHGSATIHITFSGRARDNLNGLYRCRYLSGRKEKYMLTTQFEASNARDAFPCFDEPELKAVFNVSLTVDEGLDCISNMPVEMEKRHGNGKKTVAFQATPRMAVYLLYIGIGEFRRRSVKQDGITLSVVTTPGKERYTRLPLEYAAKLLGFLERYFGIRYPLPKLDLIGIPDFAAGAMENWGAVTFREIGLLGDEKSSVAVKQRIAEVIAHEFTHQWFGDLVTMRWWNDLWLNESFANLMSYKALDAVFPEWKVMDQYLAEEVASALAADQLGSTHPISVRVNTPEEIAQIFDRISYEKGGAVLDMIEDYVGSEVFRKGLGIYLKRHAYSNASKEDLWNAIEESARRKGKRLSVPEVARSWVDNKGYPAITVKQERGKLLLSQKKFMLLDRKPENASWPVPINASYPPTARKAKFLMKGRQQSIALDGGSHLKLNHGQRGFYRTIYQRNMLDSLGELIKSSDLSWIDAWGIENDLYALAKKGTYKLEDYLGFVDRYCFAAKYPLNASVLGHLRGLYGLFYPLDNRASGMLRTMLDNYSFEILKEVGWRREKSEDQTTTMVRTGAVMASGFSGNRITLNKTAKMFYRREWQETDPNLKAAVFGLAAWSGSAKTYATMKARYAKSQVLEDRIKMLGSMGMFRDPSLLGRALDFSLSKAVRYQDSYYIPVYASSNPAAGQAVWLWTRRNWSQLMKRFNPGAHMLGRYVENLASTTDRKAMDEVRRFFRRKRNFRSDITNALSQTLEIIEINSRFVERNMHMDVEE